jgi:hypothetical protein
VGKSTLFNALLRAHKAAVANYPFCTIEPNLGVVSVPDPRLAPLAKLVHVQQIIPAAIEFFDIAGLVKGASQGEGLGNKFLSHIREVDAILHVVRGFDDPDITHVTGTLDPVRDIEIVTTELVLADLEAVRKRHEKIAKDTKKGDKHAVAEEAVLRKLEPHLTSGQPAATLGLAPEERALSRNCFLLTEKPTLFAVNLKEADLAEAEANPHATRVGDYARTHHACGTVVVCAQLESDLNELSPNEAQEYLRELGVKESGVAALIRAAYQLLGLRTFFSFNETECRAWTIHAGDTAPKAAGVIHSDFERGFIKADTIHFDQLVRCGSIAHAREQGLYRSEGKEYLVQDGDVIHFKFHV